MNRSPLARIFATTILVAGLMFAGLCYCDDAPPDDWKAPPDAVKKLNPVKVDAASIEAGKKVYATSCVMCHGSAGRGDGPAAREISPPPKDLSDPKIVAQSDGELFWRITTGKAPMPAFGEKNMLSETDRWEVINYLRVLCPPPATRPAGT